MPFKEDGIHLPEQTLEGVFKGIGEKVGRAAQPGGAAVLFHLPEHAVGALHLRVVHFLPGLAPGGVRVGAHACQQRQQEGLVPFRLFPVGPHVAQGGAAAPFALEAADARIDAQPQMDKALAALPGPLQHEGKEGVRGVGRRVLP